MPFEDFVVCDADMHVMEPADLWQRYMTPEYRHAAPIGMTELKRDIRVKVKSQVLLRAGPVRPLKERGGSGIGWRPRPGGRLRRGRGARLGRAGAARRDGPRGRRPHRAVPDARLFALGLDSTEQIGADGLEPSFATAIARAYNDWLHDYCQLAPDRIYGAAMVAPHDIAGAVDETRRCVEEYGFKAIYLAPGCVNRMPWHHRAYDPLWAECQKQGIAVGFHGGGRTLLTPDFSLGDIFGDRLMMWHTFNQPLGVMAAAVSLIGGGVLERFPELRVALLEGNCSWAPWLMHRLDEHHEWVGWYEARDLTKKPSSTSAPTASSPSRPTRRPSCTTSTGSATTTSCSPPTIRTAIRSIRTRSRRSASCRSPRRRSARSPATTGAGSTTFRSRASARASRSRIYKPARYAARGIVA
jgi:predicted TIM-barrel fold metal-dependent hydrolase